ncbi:transcriptional regulator, LysR family [Tistlia consotensis]|uniref:Transcriptional regulator, LysR family n=1 Tax=Tistlia consotensis USBA 355 TaxID=560819 RepID=A0A1Y6B5A6_9PROT|nr:LysR substrate-binding domain-containing protein [Tistlia consotensis]SME88506.1 transcriptional regulator, LysR family [Tistlia consotensis USBA 355]SNR24963.1 transcriptional regulator, LysR family [Tistlia consotensis]
MNFSQMRAFHAVAQTGSFSLAAQRLGVTQPAVTVQVKALEESLGTLLFVRGGARAELTADGQRLLGPVQRIVRTLEEIQHEMAATRELRRGLLRIGLSTPATVLSLVARYAALYPGIELALQVGNTDQLTADLAASRVDVIFASQITCDAQYFNLALGRQEIVLVAPGDHPLAARGSVTPRELAGLPLVLREEGSVTRAVFLAALRKAGVEPRSVASLGSREMVKEAAAAGLGLGVVFSGEVGEDRRLATVRLDCPPGLGADLGADVYLTCRTDLAGLGAVGALVRLAVEQLEGA